MPINQNTELLIDTEHPRIYKASRYWDFNVWGATVAGIGMGILMSVVSAILLFDSEGPSGRRFGGFVILTIIATFLAMFPGNMLAAVPVAVELEEGKGLCLIAPLKKLCIPFNEVQEVRDSTLGQIFQQGIVVKLNKRHGLMKSFIIHVAFGEQGRKLARAIQQEISRRGN
ncbi:MAG: hypothetical protein WA765_15800 [Candidatus Acidiferrum sp.]